MKKLPIIVFSLLCVALTGCVTVSNQNSSTSPKPNYSQAYDDYVRLAAHYMGLNRFDLAEPRLKRAIAIDSQQPEAWNALGVLYDETGNIEAGNEVFKNLISSHPDYQLGYMNYASFLCNYNRYNELDTFYSQMRAKGLVFSTLSYIAEGNCDLKNRRLTKANAAYRQALSYDANAAGALLPLAEIAIEQKNYQQALSYLDVVHTYVEYSPQSVKLAILAARGARNSAVESNMTQIMESRYANSPQAKSLGL